MTFNVSTHQHVLGEFAGPDALAGPGAGGGGGAPGKPASCYQSVKV